jgi:hypothetical protein
MAARTGQWWSSANHLIWRGKIFRPLLRLPIALSDGQVWFGGRDRKGMKNRKFSCDICVKYLQFQ